MEGPREIFLIETEDPRFGTVLMQPPALPEVVDHARYVRADDYNEAVDALKGIWDALNMDPLGKHFDEWAKVRDAIAKAERDEP